MNRALLKTIILEQQKIGLVRHDIERQLVIQPDTLMHTENIVIITGVRRCGKSTLLQHFRKLHKENHYYLNFDDERLLNFTVVDFQLMMEIFIELFGEEKICYFDEMQNIVGWERFVSRLYEQRYKIFVTGSNAKMLSQEMGTHLTGRYLKLELYPFSFLEFCDFKKRNINIKKITTSERANLNKAIEIYVKLGGFPQYLKEELLEYLQTLYEGILYRDIIVRYKLPSEHAIKQLVFYFASNVGKEITYNTLRKLLKLGSTNTIADYCQYLENCYLFFLIKRFNYSLKAQSASPKKVYAIDTGMAHAIGFRASQDTGRMLENIVFIELKRRGYEIYYHREKKECDFVACKQNHIKQLIQVCYDLSDDETKQREIAGLVEAMTIYQLKQGWIINLTESDNIEIKINNKLHHIEIISIWAWIVSKNDGL